MTSEGCCGILHRRKGTEAASEVTRKPMATRSFAVRALAGSALLALTLVAGAEHLGQPAGPVILSVEGRIGHTNRGASADLDRAMLEGLGLATLVTHTPWTDGPREFTGIPFARLLDHLEASGEKAVARALNDYVVAIPLADIRRKRAFVALDMDGKALSIRDKGPIWVVFPWDENPALDDQATKHQSIWQLRTLSIE